MQEKIEDWIKKQVKQAHAKGVVLGLSGGVDSSVVACLAKNSLSRKRVLALILPCHSQGEDLEDAKLVAKIFGIRTQILDLSDIYDSLIKILPEAHKLARINLKPRLRMLTLYYFANKLNYLVCGTSNKTEITIGYFTKHGDGAADILPIGDLFKKQVRVLAEKLGIPGRIISKPPTAGLWSGQTDEGEIGLTYAELDDILERMEDKKKQKASMDKINKVKMMVANSEHKRLGPRVHYIK
jgi:NAD+ synthase